MSPPTCTRAPRSAEDPGAPPTSSCQLDPPRAAGGGVSAGVPTCSACPRTSFLARLTTFPSNPGMCSSPASLSTPRDDQWGLEVSTQISQPPTPGRCEGAYPGVPSRIKPQSPTALIVHTLACHLSAGVGQGGFSSFSVLLSLLPPLCFLGSPPR